MFTSPCPRRSQSIPGAGGLHHGDPDRRLDGDSPKDYYEAAAIDGASGRCQVFWHITLPLLMPVLTVTTVLNLLYGLKVFDIVFVLTNGGPGRHGHGLHRHLR